MAGYRVCFCKSITAEPVAFGDSIDVRVGEKYDPKIDLMRQDRYHMARKMGKNVELMFSTHDNQDMKYLIIVNTKTGESVRLMFK
jgi:hypothetical protein